MGHDLNIRAKTIQLLEENIGINLHNLEFVNEYSDKTTKAQSTKEKNR